MKVILKTLLSIAVIKINDKKEHAHLVRVLLDSSLQLHFLAE